MKIELGKVAAVGILQIAFSGIAFAQVAEAVPAIELEPDSWACVNNGHPACENPPGPYQASGEVLEPDHWNCINNSAGVCENPPGPYHVSGKILEPDHWNCINNGSAVCENPATFTVVVPD